MLKTFSQPQQPAVRRGLGAGVSGVQIGRAGGRGGGGNTPSHAIVHGCSAETPQLAGGLLLLGQVDTLTFEHMQQRLRALHDLRAKISTLRSSGRVLGIGCLWGAQCTRIARLGREGLGAGRTF